LRSLMCSLSAGAGRASLRDYTIALRLLATHPAPTVG
jgi:hypothetical protein